MNHRDNSPTYSSRVTGVGKNKQTGEAVALKHKPRAWPLSPKKKTKLLNEGASGKSGLGR